MDITRIGKIMLREKLHDPNIILIDVRRDRENASAKIPGALLEDPDRVEQWQEKYPKDHQIILYCS